MSTATEPEVDRQIREMDAEQLPAGEHELHGAGHFAGLYAAENVAGTEFIFGATFVILGASMVDVLIGLAIGNLLAVLSFRFLAIGGSDIFTGETPSGGEGISLLGIIGLSWGANSFAHSGMIDMSLLRYAKKSWYGYLSATGMFLSRSVLPARAWESPAGRGFRHLSGVATPDKCRNRSPSSRRRSGGRWGRMQLAAAVA